MDKGKQPKKPQVLDDEEMDSSGEEVETASSDGEDEEEMDVEEGNEENEEEEHEEDEDDEEDELQRMINDDDDDEVEEEDEEDDEAARDRAEHEAHVARRKALKAFAGREESSLAKVTKRPSTKRDEQEELMNREEEYEQGPRSVASGWKAEEEKHELLPIKNMSGKVIQQKSVKKVVKKKAEEEEEEAEAEEDEEEDEEEDDVQQKASKGEKNLGSLYVKLKNLTGHPRVAKAKELLADLAEQILIDPEGMINSLKDMVGLCHDTDGGTRRAALMASLLVLKDILPGYQVRDHKATGEDGAKLSKEVDELQHFETTILKQYSAYVRVLASSKVKSPDGKVATKCLCVLLTRANHFNLYPYIVKAVVPKMNSKDKFISNECCSAVKELFEKDPSGESSLEIVKQFTHIGKGKPEQILAPAMATMLSLKLTEAMTEIETGKKKKLSGNQIKKMKQRRVYEKEVEKELKETEAEAGRKEVSRLHTEMLRMLFTMYFRFLKQTPGSKVFPVVLAGVAKFAHLISVDFTSDLMKSLEVVMANTEVPHGTALSAVLSVLKLVKMHGQYLNLDLKAVHTYLYGRLKVALIPDELLEDEDEGVEDEDEDEDEEKEEKEEPEQAEGPGEDAAAVSRMVIECLQHLLINKSQLNTDRAAGFARHLLTCSLQCQPNVAIAVQSVLIGLIQRFPKLGAMFDTERGAFGQYRADVEDPEYCNALSSTAWEVCLLQAHYHPTVATFAKAIATGNKLPLSLGAASALDLYRTFNCAPGCTFDLRPAMDQPPKKKDHKKRPLSVPETPIDEWVDMKVGKSKAPDFTRLFGRSKALKRMRETMAEYRKRGYE